MSLQHFFLEDQSIEQTLASVEDDASFVLNLSQDDIKHARALRLQCGEHIGVIDCNAVYYECEVAEFDTRELKVRVTLKCPQGRGEVDGLASCNVDGRKSSEPSDPIDITLIFGLMKASKNDDVIRACTEIGVSGFVPFDANRSVAKLDSKSCGKKLERWKKIAKSAAMQSGQFRIPEVCAPKSCAHLCEYLGDFDEVVIFWEEAYADDLYKVSSYAASGSKSEIAYKSDMASPSKKIAIVIGPEGGLCRDEVDLISKANKNSEICSLGRSILRAQTACVLACGLVKYENEKVLSKDVR